jgi:hypothetical protein
MESRRPTLKDVDDLLSRLEGPNITHYTIVDDRGGPVAERRNVELPLDEDKLAAAKLIRFLILEVDRHDDKIK